MTEFAGLQHRQALDVISREACRCLHFFDAQEKDDPDSEFGQIGLMESGAFERYRIDAVFHAKVKALSHSILNALEEHQDLFSSERRAG